MDATDTIKLICDENDEEGRLQMYRDLEAFFTRATDSVVERYALMCDEIDDADQRSRRLHEMYNNLEGILMRTANRLGSQTTLLLATRPGRGRDVDS